MDVIIGPLARVLIIAIDLYIWVLVANVILSWLFAFNVVNPHNRLVGMIAEFADRLTAPALRPIRNLIPPVGGFDISPVILILILIFLSDFLVRMAMKFA